MSTWAVRNKLSERAAKESVLRVHLLPALRNKPLDQITTLDVTELVAKLLGPDPAKPLRSAKRVNNILNVLSKLLREAQEAELIAVLPKLRTLKIGTTAFEFWTFEDFEKLLASSEAEPEWRAAILVAGEAGLRAGEVAPLRWEDVTVRQWT
jgi:integrase